MHFTSIAGRICAPHLPHRLPPAPPGILPRWACKCCVPKCGVPLTPCSCGGGCGCQPNLRPFYAYTCIPALTDFDVKMANWWRPKACWA